VLTTMKIAHLKWIGMAVLATGLSAGSVVAVSYAAYQTTPGTDRDESSVVEAANPQLEVAQASKPAAPANHSDESSVVETAKARLVLAQADLEAAQSARDAAAARVEQYRAELVAAQSQDAAPAAKPAPVVLDLQEQAKGQRNPRPAMLGNLRSERFDALEQKVNELLKRLDANPRTPSPDRPDIESQKKLPSSAKSIQELEAQLKQVLLERDNTKRLFEKNAVSARELELYHNKVLVVVGQIEGLDEDLADEIARLKLEMRRKNAEREKAEAQKEVAQSVAARNSRLNERKPGMIASEDVAKAEGEAKVAQAQVGIVEAEVAGVGLRIQQLERRRERIKQAMVLANGEKAAAMAPTGPDVKKSENGGDPFKVPSNNLERRGFTGQ
jgi:hypothetical protein